MPDMVFGYIGATANNIFAKNGKIFKSELLVDMNSFAVWRPAFGVHVLKSEALLSVNYLQKWDV